MNTPAAEVLPAGAGSSHRFYVVTGSSSTETEEFDAVVVATPADVAGQQLAEIAPVAADILGSMDLASSVVLGLRLPNDEAIPETTGILVSSDAGLHAKAFTFSSRKWPTLMIKLVLLSELHSAIGATIHSSGKTKTRW